VVEVAVYSLAWKITEILLPLSLVALLSHQAGEKIRSSKFAPGRALGLSLIGIGWLGYSLITFLVLINLVAPLIAWIWTVFMR